MDPGRAATAASPGANCAAICDCYHCLLFCMLQHRFVVSKNNFTFLNHFMGIYDNFWMICDWPIDYKSVARPIEL
jgi:hypothetical protein